MKIRISNELLTIITVGISQMEWDVRVSEAAMFKYWINFYSVVLGEDLITIKPRIVPKPLSLLSPGLTDL